MDIKIKMRIFRIKIINLMLAIKIMRLLLHKTKNKGMKVIRIRQTVIIMKFQEKKMYKIQNKKVLQIIINSQNL